MQLNPRYGTDPVITIDGDPAAIATPTIRQRRRLVETLRGLNDAEWAHPSRCAGWSARDVIIHLSSTNLFWAHAIGCGLAGEPSEVLATFDPVASPAEFVAAGQETPTAELLDGFVASTEAFVEVLGSVGDDQWSIRAEAPPGHISISAVTHHALWDSWVHERDVMLPIGGTPVVEDDEVAASLRYVAALGPAVAVNVGRGGTGIVTVEAADPEITFSVEIGDRVSVDAPRDDADVRLRGNAVHLLEALSRREPLDQAIPADKAWMVGGLAEIFDEVD